MVLGCRGLAPRAAWLPVGEAAARPTRILGSFSTPELSGDASLASLAFASDRSGAGDIFVMSPHSLFQLTDHPAGDWDPVWSPSCADATRTCYIAFTSQRSGDSEIWLMDDRGRNLRNVTQHPAWDYWPTWSPDGRQLAFISERDGDPELYIQAIDDSQAVQLTFNTESDRLPAWSPTGRQIAFAGVRQGIEEVYVIDLPPARQPPARERAITDWPLNGSAPTWSPDGERVAFVGWDEDNHPGIYIVGRAGGDPQLVWKSSAWIGSITWVPDPRSPGQEGQLLFTSWQGGNHELYSLPAAGGTPLRLTQHPGWDDFPAWRPGRPFTPLAGERSASAGDVETSPHATDDLILGFNIADLGNAYLVRDMGWSWAKGYVNWETVEPARGQYRWVDPDHTVHAFRSQGLHILLRVQGTPLWARPSDTPLSHPPNDLNDFATFMQALAGHFRGEVDAYEIWNEPNLNYEWGYLPPDPARYAAMLKAVYPAVKAGDPQALVISAGLATTGEGSDTAMGDLEYLRARYAAGARGYFDALGSHPYAFGHDPDYEDPWGLCLSRVAQQREVMLAYGDATTPVWITELGWVLHSSWDLVEHERIGVNELQQARYLVRAYEKTRAEWPWIRALFVFNLDFSSVPWYPAAEPMRWYAILNPDRTPRPAYSQLSGTR